MILIGGSAGAIPALIQLLARLPADYAVPIIIALHISAKMPSRLPQVLTSQTDFPTAWVAQGLRPTRGAHVVPPGVHAEFALDGTLQLLEGRISPRPSVDRLFLSAAHVLRSTAVGVILSGMLGDGARGIAALRRAGAVVMAQDEASSDWFDMPAAAIDIGGSDIILPPFGLAAALSAIAPNGAETGA